MSKINGVLNYYADLLNTELNNAITADSDKYKIIVEAMKYSCIDGGKRIRPALLLEFYKLFGGKSTDSVKFAVALEMIHSYSLVHDDLPCMDNDDFRRGKLSCHKAYGEDIAVLTGDALLTSAFEYASTAKDIEADRVVKAINILAQGAGINGMVGGQVLDILSIDLDNIEGLKRMYSLKTGALLKTAASIGCVLAGKDEKIEYCQRYAENIGLAFQIVDDILDVEGDEQQLGKPIGSDQKNQKITFVSAYGIENAKEMVSILTESAKKCIDDIGGDGEILKEFADYLALRRF